MDELEERKLVNDRPIMNEDEEEDVFEDLEKNPVKVSYIKKIKQFY